MISPRVALIVLGTVIGSGVGLSLVSAKRTYVNMREPREYIVLKRQHRFELTELMERRSGLYIVKGDTLLLQSDRGELSIAIIRGDTLVDHHEDKWIKQ